MFKHPLHPFNARPRSSATVYPTGYPVLASPSVLGEVIRPLIKRILTARGFFSGLVGMEYLFPS
ncbi:hypothetical protein ACQKLN_28825 [Paenibacillus glucanolyticus]|uniref:hypothetical protein n=1 Tax=Paenibacillus TaxID=44249 RepID=UPI00031E6E92|nr:MULTISPECIES: hypothetical protein [Paenibacillus]